MKTYKFTPKQCPFCSVGYELDDRSKNGLGKCNHEFTSTEYNAYVFSIEQTKKELKENQKILNKMRKIMIAQEGNK